MTGRLLRLELRNNVVPWLLPLVAGLFWLVTYRTSMAYPPLWNVRAMTMQNSSLAVFVPTVVGAAAWLGSREGRHGIAELVTGSARPRWHRQLAAWAATTCWSIVAYLGCVAVLYVATAREGAWGGPLWWPAVVGAASLPAFSALGFAAGALRPSRFTPPLVAVAAFLALEISAQFIHGDHSRWQISPVVSNLWSIGPDAGIATFYPYLPDLPIAQLLFLAGLTAALLGLLGLPAGAGGAGLRRSAAVLTVAGVLSTGAAIGLAGTARLDPHGLIAIPALHDAADDLPVGFTPACAEAALPVCVHPAYRRYLPALVDGLRPVLAELAGLPGAPVRIEQVAAEYEHEGGNDVSIRRSGDSVSGSPPVFNVLLPTRPSSDEIRATLGRDIVQHLTGGGRGAGAAQQAVTDALAHTGDLTPGSPAARFAALPAAERRAWLTAHLPALRSGQLTLADLP